jgi:hypothetical protein
MEWGPDNALPDGGTGCIGRWNATCAGQSYEVDCSCPEGACVCFGATTHVVTFPACSSLASFCEAAAPSVQQVFTLCGFPVPGS